MAEVIKHIEPDALIVLNHDLEPCSHEIYAVAAAEGERAYGHCDLCALSVGTLNCGGKNEGLTRKGD